MASIEVYGGQRSLAFELTNSLYLSKRKKKNRYNVHM